MRAGPARHGTVWTRLHWRTEPCWSEPNRAGTVKSASVNAVLEKDNVPSGFSWKQRFVAVGVQYAALQIRPRIRRGHVPHKFSLKPHPQPTCSLAKERP